VKYEIDNFGYCFPFEPSNGSRILAIFPSSSKSHYFVGVSLMKGLAEKGHDITLIAPFKEKHPITNLKTIHLKEVFDYYEAIKKNALNLRNIGILQKSTHIFDYKVVETRLILENKNVQKLLDSAQEFDLIICEIKMSEALLGFGQHFKTPIIAMSASGTNKWTNYLVGNPSPLSYVRNTLLGFSSDMSFSDRAWNVAITTFEEIYYNFFYFHKQVSLYNKFFKDPKPALEDICKNVSLVLLT
uniref:Glucuronosyltransferase n=1 Tax=Megaselia scalaris TaxID=36166 RepID=T1GTV7_MEGSC